MGLLLRDAMAPWQAMPRAADTVGLRHVVKPVGFSAHPPACPERLFPGDFCCSVFLLSVECALWLLFSQIH